MRTPLNRKEKRPIPSQAGRTAIVTGASSGIGLYTALGLAKAGAKVILVCRSQVRGEDTKRLIARQSGNEPDLVLADFASLKSVHNAAKRIADGFNEIHILVNNVGAFAPVRKLTVDGYETTFAVNHLAPFLFTNTLIPTLAGSGEERRNARIVTVASNASNRASIDFGDLMSSRRYSVFRAYAQSKLANVLFTVELARRLPPKPVTANCLHPGVVGTGIGNLGGVMGAAWSLLRPLVLTPEQGAENSLYVATAPEIEGKSGLYFVKERPARPNPIAEDAHAARRLWTESERLVEAALEKAHASA
ncbi:short-chain dehydrogenase [Rhodomicrobium udaipurense JA643]|uniref:SDR family oxidoreductase n=1 Tax=Rhodomicrobium udaipurense TaxID=1202716 RepID=A0A8I1GEU9_9HYPH|nr:SDR family oxidoreductase [Rhodomicrobium udaipurense]KAI93608.1 short-chain dehydrogenase [Rhodomicrobium udaipurense JA643]MBJ7542521.1 SDR family oxidoreductase [Rhodomicrobium udaipurense]